MDSTGPFIFTTHMAGPVGEYFLFTHAAQLTTLPVTAYHFQRISLVSLVANPFILPAQPVVMIAGGLAVIFGFVWRRSPHSSGLAGSSLTHRRPHGCLPRLVEHYPPQNVQWAGPTNVSYSAQSLHAALVRADVPILLAEAGQMLDLGQGARLEVCSAGQRSAVLLLEWGGFRAQLPVGISRAELETLDYGAGSGPVSVLLLADGGCELSTIE